MRKLETLTAAEGGGSADTRSLSKALLGGGLGLLLGFALAGDEAALAPVGDTTGVASAALTDGTLIRSNKVKVAKSYGKLPLIFEANQGQADDRVKFLSRGLGYTLFLTPSEAVLVLRNDETGPSPVSREAAGGQEQPGDTRTAVLRMQLVGSDPNHGIAGLNALAGKSHYLIGNDPERWRTNIPHYGKVRYEGVYPGIDLVFYGKQRLLEYDFVVAPGADPGAIQLGLEGAERIEVDARGDLVLHLPDGQVRFHKPYVYQVVDGVKRT